MMNLFNLNTVWFFGSGNRNPPQNSQNNSNTTINNQDNTDIHFMDFFLFDKSENIENRIKTDENSPTKIHISCFDNQNNKVKQKIYDINDINKYYDFIKIENKGIISIGLLFPKNYINTNINIKNDILNEIKNPQIFKEIVPALRINRNLTQDGFDLEEENNNNKPNDIFKMKYFIKTKPVNNFRNSLKNNNNNNKGNNSSKKSNNNGFLNTNKKTPVKINQTTFNNQNDTRNATALPNIYYNTLKGNINNQNQNNNKSNNNNNNNGPSENYKNNNNCVDNSNNNEFGNNDSNNYGNNINNNNSTNYCNNNNEGNNYGNNNNNYGNNYGNNNNNYGNYNNNYGNNYGNNNNNNGNNYGYNNNNYGNNYGNNTNYYGNSYGNNYNFNNNNNNGNNAIYNNPNYYNNGSSNNSSMNSYINNNNTNNTSFSFNNGNGQNNYYNQNQYNTQNNYNNNYQNQNNIQNYNNNQNQINNQYNNNNNQNQINQNNNNNQNTNIIPQNPQQNIKYYFSEKGLNNIGSTCYMNATLQCLLHINELVDYFLNSYKNEYINLKKINKYAESQGNLSNAFYELVKGVESNDDDNNDMSQSNINNMFGSKTKIMPKKKKSKKNFYDFNYSNSSNSFSPDNFKKILGYYNPQFRRFEANDSKDLILYLLQTMHEELNYYGSNNLPSIIRPPNQLNRYETYLYFNNTYNTRNFSIISTIFYGTYENTTKCLKCNNNIYNFQKFEFISFGMCDYHKKTFNIYDGFADNEKEQLLSGDNQFYCNVCRQLCDAKISCKIIQPPNKLLINIDYGKNKRFQPSKIEFGENINITKFVNFNFGYELKYRIVGVCTHLGYSGSFGHYIAYCKHRQTGQWYKFNDSSCNKCSGSEIYGGSPYLLLYEKID